MLEQARSQFFEMVFVGAGKMTRYNYTSNDERTRGHVERAGSVCSLRRRPEMKIGAAAGRAVTALIFDFHSERCRKMDVAPY